MTTQTTLSDAELIVKGYNAIIEDAQYEFEEVKEEVLLQLEDLEEDFDTYREFELRLEAYENGAFDPDIEKILGIGGRKAGTWNPLSEQAGINREDSRTEKRRRQGLVRTDNKAREKAVAGQKKPGLQPIDATQFKGRQPGGEAKGATRRARYNKDESKNIEGDEIDVKTGEKRTQYKGGDLSNRDTFAGAIARKVIGGRKKLGEAKGKLDQRENIRRKIGETKDRATAGVADTATAGKEKAQSGGSKVAGVVSEVGRRGKVASTLVSGGVRSAKDVVATGKVQPRIYDPPKPIDKKKADRPADAVKPPVLSENKPKPKWGEAGFASARGDWASKSFTDRLRKSMGYRPRRRYDDRLPW